MTEKYDFLKFFSILEAKSSLCSILKKFLNYHLSFCMFQRLISFFTLGIICLSCTSKKENDTNFLFKEVPSKKSGISFSNDIKEDNEHNIINYIYYYNGGGVAVGDINNDNLPDLFFVSNQNKNKLYLNEGGLKFKDISNVSGISGNSSWNSGVTMADINGDGFLDIYVCAISKLLDFKGHNELFINNGDGTFSEKSKEYGLDYEGYSTQSYFFDYDKDGDLDMYLVNHAIHNADAHGPADIRKKRVPLVGDILFKNENGKFVNASESANIYGGANGYGLSASIADFNNDGWEDIYVCNDFHEDDYYYLNNQDGSFTERLEHSFSVTSRFSMGSDAADINKDGYMDLITLDMLPSDERAIKESEGEDVMLNSENQLRRLGYKNQYTRNMLHVSNNGTHFSEQAIINNVSNTDWSWASLIADFNNDTHQDLFIANGILRRPNDLDFTKFISTKYRNKKKSKDNSWMYESLNEMPSGKIANEIFQGNSNKFVNKTGDWINSKPSLSNGAVYADLDLDGDLDLVLNNLNETASIFENTTTGKNYISVSLIYKDKNIEGIGSRVIVYANNNIQVKELQKSRGFISSIESKLTFGLDTINKVDSIRVIWPNHTLQTIVNPKHNQNLEITYKTSGINYQFKPLSTKAYFKKDTSFKFRHQEDSYIDFYRQRLIPYMISKQGPAFAIGDIDNNGFNDVFIGNASGQEAALFLNNGIELQRKDTPTLATDKICEDNTAHFIDVDNDGDLDLYVGSGINPLAKSSKKYLEDRLYINTNGNFEKSEGKLPGNTLVTSCVSSYDYDADGDMDLFVGNLSNPLDFGESVASFLLKNDGQGNFTKDETFKLVSKVNDAVWKDINNDGSKDLIVATEWDVPKIFINSGNSLEELKVTTKNMNGLWQSVTTYDIDEDGDQDIILGNWGLNTKFSINSGTLKMYYNDFDKNGKKETIVAYNIDGKYYPIYSKDELASQMITLKKKFLTYKDFALKSVEDIVGDDAIKTATAFEVNNLASGYLENNNGNFDKFIPLPSEFQLAPINAFNAIKINNESQLLVSGNSFKVSAYHGSYSSLKGYILKNTKTFKPVSDFGITPFNSQIKGAASLPMKEDNLLLILKNDTLVDTYKFKK